MIKFELIKGDSYPLIQPREAVFAYVTDTGGGVDAHILSAEEAIAVSLANIHSILVAIAQNMDVAI